METDSFVSWQFGFTLLAALAIAVWMFMRVQRSRKKDEQSSLAAPEPAHRTDPRT